MEAALKKTDSRTDVRQVVRENPMRTIRVEKVVLNMGCGTKLNPEHAKTILEMITASKAVITKTKRRTTFNVPKNKAIGCKVTVRKSAAEFLRRLLEAKDNRLKASSFDSTGNFSFGIKEYIDIPGTDYNPKIGLLGMDVCVSLSRLGYSIKYRKFPGKLGRKHLITKEEAIGFTKKFGAKIEE